MKILFVMVAVISIIGIVYLWNDFSTANNLEQDLSCTESSALTVGLGKKVFNAPREDIWTLEGNDIVYSIPGSKTGNSVCVDENIQVVSAKKLGLKILPESCSRNEHCGHSNITATITPEHNPGSDGFIGECIYPATPYDFTPQGDLGDSCKYVFYADSLRIKIRFWSGVYLEAEMEKLKELVTEEIRNLYFKERELNKVWRIE